MAGTILENLSTKKISILVALLLVCQAISFLIGGLIAPVPAGNQNIQAVLCKDLPGSHNSTNVWIYSRGKGACKPVILSSNEDEEYTMVNQIVFVFQIPIPRGGYILDYSRWQQNLIGVVHFDNNHLKDPDAVITIDARLAYRNKGDADEDWKLLAASVERRFLNCHLLDPTNDDQLYSCDTIPLFELGSLHHDYYLLNVRFPVDSDLKMNLDVGGIEDLQLTTIYQNGGFTKVWLSLKTIFFPIVVAVLIWFWHRVHILQRSPALIEYMLVGLGSALTFLNIPLEYLTLWFDMPVMLLLSDIRQGVFYATLLSFWLVFSGEHMLIQETGKRSTVKNYWKHLSAVVVGCISLFAFDLCERGMQLRNPFYSIWASRIGTNLAMTFIVLAGISAGIYFLFLCYMIWKVFRNISMKQSSLPSMSAARRIHYEGIIYRFKFLMLATVICAALTVIGFMMEQAAEGHWKWDEDIEVQLTSAFLTGVYGMWNIYILALIILYAPSHKQWPNDTNSSTERIASEEIEFNNLPSDSNPSEISSLTSFSRKAAFD